MLKRILASMALTSLVLAGVLLVFWWRSTHGHVDEYTLGKSSPTQSHFICGHGRVAMEVTDQVGDQVETKMQFYDFRNLIAYCLIIPALWLAIKVRSWLPRPPGRQRHMTKLE